MYQILIFQQSFSHLLDQTIVKCVQTLVVEISHSNLKFQDGIAVLQQHKYELDDPHAVKYKCQIGHNNKFFV